MHQRRRPGSAVHEGRSQRSSPRWRPLIAVAVEIAVATWHARVSDAGSRRSPSTTSMPSALRSSTAPAPPSFAPAPSQACRTRQDGGRSVRRACPWLPRPGSQALPSCQAAGRAAYRTADRLSAPGPTALEALDDDIEPHHPVRRRDARAAACHHRAVRRHRRVDRAGRTARPGGLPRHRRGCAAWRSSSSALGAP